ncbi:hypothetical protein Tcan_01538, partial [Toxocara canis]
MSPVLLIILAPLDNVSVLAVIFVKCTRTGNNSFCESTHLMCVPAYEVLYRYAKMHLAIHKCVMLCRSANSSLRSSCNVNLCCRHSSMNRLSPHSYQRQFATRLSLILRKRSFNCSNFNESIFS